MDQRIMYEKQHLHSVIQLQISFSLQLGTPASDQLQVALSPKVRVGLDTDKNSYRVQFSPACDVLRQKAKYLKLSHNIMDDSKLSCKAVMDTEKISVLSKYMQDHNQFHHSTITSRLHLLQVKTFSCEQYNIVNGHPREVNYKCHYYLSIAIWNSFGIQVLIQLSK